MKRHRYGGRHRHGVQVGLLLISCFYVFVMNLFRINFSLNELKEDRMKREREYLATHKKRCFLKLTVKTALCPVPSGKRRK